MSRWKIVIHSWQNSIKDLYHYVLSTSRKRVVRRFIAVGAGVFCLAFAGYLVLINSPFFMSIPETPKIPEFEEQGVETYLISPQSQEEDVVDTVSRVPQRAEPKGAEVVEPAPVEPAVDKPAEQSIADRLPTPAEPQPAPQVVERIPEPVDPSTMSWPVTGTVLTKYGWYRHPTYKDWRFSPGVVVTAPEGVPVRAVLPGRVKRSSYTPDKGLVVEVEHGNGWSTVYGYLSDALVETGQTIDKGHTLGRVGISSFGESALFFSVSFEQEDIDPMAFLR